MIRTLVRKELREHVAGLTLLGLSLAAMLFLLLAAVAVGRGERGPFDALRAFVILASVFGSSTLCHFLISREYTGRTQLFLETLPVARHTVLAVKLLLGLSALMVWLALAVILCAWMARHSVPLDARMALLISARAGAFGFFGYACFFAFSFLGRYRIACIMLVCLAVAYVSDAKDVELSRFGPLALVDQRFSTERTVPTEDLAWVLGLSASLVSLGFLLGLGREGSVAALLAESMSQREKVFVAVLGIVTLVGITIVEGRKEKRPFDLQDAIVAEGKGARVKLSPAGQPDGQRLVDRVHGDMVSLAEYMGIQTLPPVFLTTRRDLDPFRFERGKVGKSEGIAVRLRYPVEGWSDDALLSWITREAMVSHTRGRAEMEPGRWLLDGFGLYWARRSHAGEPLGSVPDLTLRALYGTPAGLKADDLARWLSFRERHGDDVASAVAWSGLQTLSRQTGDERVRRLLRATLGVRPPPDVRASWRSWRSPLPDVFQQATGLTYESFLDRWKADLEAERLARAEELARLPRLAGAVKVWPLSDTTRRVGYELRTEAPPPPGARVRFRYAALPLLEAEIDPETVRDDDRFFPLPEDADIPGTWARGARLAWTFSLRSELLGCEVISGWTREEVR